MKKALVVGGSNGIGLALSNQFIEKGFFVYVLDREFGDLDILPVGRYEYIYCNLLDLEDSLFSRFVNDRDLEILMITAGIGRVASFEKHHLVEIDKILTIDTVSTIKIIRMFYERIKSENDFYTGVMGSISGWLISPLTTVYAAAKAAVVRFIESVNIELEMSGINNRILDISPASFEGSKFYGGNNDLSITGAFANEIIQKLFFRETRFIPQYEELFKGILEKYYSEPHEYGIYSYNYKKQSKRLDNSDRVQIGYLSGTFDLFHIGHLNLLKRAKQNCDYLIVGVHKSGKWKGKETFIPFDERKAVVAACKYVDKVVDSCLEDSDAWNIWHYNKLFVGSDYKGTKRFIEYENYFKDKGVEIIYFSYTKKTSSSQIRDLISNSLNSCQDEDSD